MGQVSANTKAYTNSKYGFRITYPVTGIGPTGATISCGNNIVENDSSDPFLGHQISFENYFGISIISWQKTISDYMNQYLTGITVSPVSTSGISADEAVIKTQSTGPSSVIYIFRKNNELVRFDSNNGVLGGCLPDKNWKLLDNFKFIQ